MLHLAPTLLDAAQVPIPPAFQGRSHWHSIRDGGSYDEVAISECVDGCTNPFRYENRLGSRVLAVREARFKLIVRFHPLAEHLYDLDADPREQNPLPAIAENAVRRRLLEVAREHLRRSVAERDPVARLQVRVRDLRLEWNKRAEKASPIAS